MGQGLVRIPALPAPLQVTFQHEAHDGPPALLKLFEDIPGDFDLPLVILAGVVVRAVHHHSTGQPFAGDGGFSAGDVFDAVIGAPTAAAQHDVMIGVAGGLDDRGDPVGIHADKMVRAAAGDHRIDGHLQAAFGPVLEADRHGEAAGHFPVNLAFRGARADGGPAQEIDYIS